MAQYPQEFIDRLHLIWGAGYLSPGGPMEVGRIVEGLDLKDRLVLDIGCGTAGPAIHLATGYGARMICIDVEASVLENAKRHAEAAGVADRMEFQLVEPGPLTFADESFDFVFSKDSMIHIPDKPALFADVFRVLKRGGVFAASDWLAGEDADNNPAFQRYLEIGHLKFTMATAVATKAAMKAAGFKRVQSVDRGKWYGKVSADEVKAIEGPLREQIIEVSDQATYDQWLAARRASSEAAQSGGLCPTILRGIRPLDS